jgi:hypothetical protein
MSMRLVALVTVLALLGGCFGYNKSAKRWAYVGNTVLILGGGGAIAADQLGGESEMSNVPTAAKTYDPPFSGVMLAGAMLVAGGLFGMIFNATRPNVKTSR